MKVWCCLGLKPSQEISWRFFSFPLDCEWIWSRLVASTISRPTQRLIQPRTDVVEVECISRAASREVATPGRSGDPKVSGGCQSKWNLLLSAACGGLDCFLWLVEFAVPSKKRFAWELSCLSPLSRTFRLFCESRLTFKQIRQSMACNHVARVCIFDLQPASVYLCI